LSEKNITTQLVVIGAGPGGYPAAFHAADLGTEVTLIDYREHPGGVCNYEGCIPSKALLHVSKLIDEADHASALGITYNKPEIDINSLRKWKDSVVNKLTAGLGQLSKFRKINYIQGRAEFINSNSLRVKTVDDEEKIVNFSKAVIATGSSPASIPGIEVDNKKILDSTGALEIEEIPKKLLVVGGGYIGLELGSVYQALGSEVTVVEMMNSLMTGVDQDLVRVLKKRLNNKFESIMLNTRVENIQDNKGKLKAQFKTDKDEIIEEEFDKVLVSVGRKPNSADLGLQNTKVKVNKRGFIEINDQRLTNDPDIYAIGDVAGDPMLAHKATYEGKIVAEIIAGKNVVYDPNAIPAVVFTDPEIAWCGITEDDAKQQGVDYTSTRFNWVASGRATTLDRNDGLTKLIIDNKTERILGMGIVGTGAGEMIAEGVLAVEMGTTATDLKLTIHPHPTLTETVMEAAEMFFGSSTHVFRKK
jgi:dihydrolipoamide dehydrogenase